MRRGERRLLEKEKMRMQSGTSLAPNLRLRRPYIAKDSDFSDRVSWVITTTTKGWPIIQTNEGIFRPSTEKDVLQLIRKHRHNFVYSMGEVDSLFKFFPKLFREELCFFKDCTWQEYYIKRLVGKVSVSEGKGKTSYLWNIRRFSTKRLRSLEDIDSFVDMLLYYFEALRVPMTSLISPASVGRDLLLRHDYKEFKLVQKFSLEVLSSFYNCYEGPRQESFGLGVVNGVDNYDLRHAHLECLRNLYSARHSFVVDVPEYLKDALYGAYFIEVEIPGGKYEFPPLPYTHRGEVGKIRCYPEGRWSDWYDKAYLDLLVEEGIPFKVIEAVQLMPTDKVLAFGGLVEHFEVLLKELPGDIHSKGLYWPTVGSFLSVYESLERTGEVIPVTTPVFHPIYGAHIQADVHCRVWRELQKVRKPVAFRSDAMTASGLTHPLPKGFAKKGSGEMFFLTYLFKDFPGSTKYRDLAHSCRDSSAVNVSRRHISSLEQHVLYGLPLGVEKEFSITLSPNPGNRLFSYPKRMGELEDGTIRSQAPPIEKVSIFAHRDFTRRNLEWLDENELLF